MTLRSGGRLLTGVLLLLQALKAAGVTEVILAINYRPEVRRGSLKARLTVFPTVLAALGGGLPWHLQQPYNCLEGAPAECILLAVLLVLLLLLSLPTHR